MPTNLELAVKQDYKDYTKKLGDLEKEKSAVDKKIEELNEKYSEVLEFMNIRNMLPKKRGGRARRGQTKEVIFGILRKARKPLRAAELIRQMKESGPEVSEASIRQQLPKLVKSGELLKDDNKAYTLAD